MVACSKRICILTETFYPVVGGGETQAQSLAEDLTASGFEVIVVARRSNRSLQKSEQIGRFTVYRVPPIGSGQLKRWPMLLSSLVALVKMRRQYDIIYVSGFKALGISAVITSKLFRKICILKADSNGEMSGEFFAGGLKKFRLTSSSLAVRMFLSTRNSLLRNADRFVAISDDIAKEFVRQGVHPNTIRYITNSVDTTRFFPVDARRKQELRQKLGIPSTSIVVTFTGRLVSYKGLPLLMRVWNEIHGEHGNMLLVLVGSGGLDMHNCEAELKEYVRANQLQESIYFTGEVRNVQEYLQMSDIFVFPTEKEAFPLALIEAMACGLPVITTPTGGIKDIVTHGENGFVVEVGDRQQLYDAIQTLIAAPSQAAHLGNAALKTVRDRYSREMVAEKYIELFAQASA